MSHIHLILAEFIERLKLHISFESILNERHVKMLDAVCDGFPYFVIINNLKNMKPVFVSYSLLKYTGTDRVSYHHADFDFYLNVFPDVNVGMFEKGLKHFRKTPDEIFTMPCAVNTPEGIRWLYGATAAIWKDNMGKAVLTLSVGCDIDAQLVHHTNNADAHRNEETVALSPEEIEQLLHLLTKREREMLHLIAKEVTKKNLAPELSISPRTVDTYYKNIFKKLGVHSATELTGIAKLLYP